MTMTMAIEAQRSLAFYTLCDRSDDPATEGALGELESSAGIAAQLAALTVRSAHDQREMHAAERRSAEAVERAHGDAEFSELEAAAAATRNAGLVAGVSDVASGACAGVSAGYRYSADVAGPTDGARAARSAAFASAARDGASGAAKVTSAVMEASAADARASASVHQRAAERTGRDATDAREAERASLEQTASAMRFLHDASATQSETLAAIARRV